MATEEICEYNVGDIGPAGGIICAVPYMNINDPNNGIQGPTVPPLQGTEFIKNPSKFYFELSPVNLNYQDCNPSNPQVLHTWGSIDSAGTLVDLNDTSYDNYWIPDQSLYYTGFNFNWNSNSYKNEIPGQGLKNTLDIYNVNNGNPNNTTPHDSLCCNAVLTGWSYENAFETCVNYNLNGYSDWFLPTTWEMEFARNYTPSGTLKDTTNVSTPGCGEPYVDTPYYWTCNALEENFVDADSAPTNVHLHDDFGPDSVNLNWGQYIDWMIVNKDSTAFMVSMNPINNTSSPHGRGWRTLHHRSRASNVRAMRRFTCEEVPPVREYNWRYLSRDYNSVGTTGYWPQSPGRMVDIEACDQQVVNPADPLTDHIAYWQYGVGGYVYGQGYQTDVMGKNWMRLKVSDVDCFGNNWTGPGAPPTAPAGVGEWGGGSQLHVTFEVYNQFEEHLGSWLYQLWGVFNQCGQPPCNKYLKFKLINQDVQVDGLTEVNLWNSSNSNIATGGASSNEYVYIKTYTSAFPSQFAKTDNLSNYLGLGIDNRRTINQLGQNTNLFKWLVVCNWCKSAEYSSCLEWFAEFTPLGSTFATIEDCAEGDCLNWGFTSEEQNVASKREDIRKKIDVIEKNCTENFKLYKK